MYVCLDEHVFVTVVLVSLALQAVVLWLRTFVSCHFLVMELALHVFVLCFSLLVCVFKYWSSSCCCCCCRLCVGVALCVECGECAPSLRFSVHGRCIGCCVADVGVRTYCVNDCVGCGCMFRVMWLYIF